MGMFSMLVALNSLLSRENPKALHKGAYSSSTVYAAQASSRIVDEHEQSAKVKRCSIRTVFVQSMLFDNKIQRCIGKLNAWGCHVNSCYSV